MMNIQEILSEQDLVALAETTGLTAAEINREYELAVEHAKADSMPKKAVNRFQRRKHKRQIDNLINAQFTPEIQRPVNERFAEMPENKQKEIYLRMIARIREENERFETMKRQVIEEKEKENG